MGNTTNFQLIFSIIFGIVAVVATLMFAGIIPGGAALTGDRAVPNIVMWGPYQDDAMVKYFNDLNEANSKLVHIKYEKQAPETYFEDLIEAFARGEGPDIFFVDQDMLNRLSGKITEIPFAIYPERNFINNFVDGSVVLNGTSTIRALPLLVDPLVLYYDRSIYTSAGLVVPPKTWPEFVKTIPLLNSRDERGNFKNTAVPLGEFRNIKNAKYIYSALTIQAGNPVTSINEYGNYQIILRESFGFQPTPAEAALNFYLQFSNPSSEFYSWNRSMNEDEELFTAGKSYTYFGFASELENLKAKNPHLNLDVLPIPQKDLARSATYGRFIGVAAAGNSKDKSGAITGAGVLAQAENVKALSEIIGIPPARRDLLAAGNSNPLIQSLYNSAVFARSWVDPNAARTFNIMQQMMENVQTGQISASAAIEEAEGNMNLLYLKNEKVTE